MRGVKNLCYVWLIVVNIQIQIWNIYMKEKLLAYIVICTYVLPVIYGLRASEARDLERLKMV